MAPKTTENTQEKPEMVKIDSLDQLKKELGVEKLDTSNDDFFKEKEIHLQISRADLDTLHAQMLGIDVQKLEKLKEIINAKQVVIVKTGKEVGFLRSKIEALLIEVNIENVKSSLDTIEKLEDVGDRSFATNYLIGRLEANGYPILIDKNKILIDSKEKLSPVLENLLNNRASENPIILDSFKTAILQRSTSLDNYIAANTDKNGKLITDKDSAKSYYELLTRESGLDKNILPISIDDIKNNPKLDQKDKAFMISYKNGAFDDVKIDEKMKQYKEDRTAKLAKADEIIENMSPVARKNLEDATRIPGDNRTIQQKTGDFLKDPFKEMGKIMTGAGPFGLLAIMGSIIYFLFKEPKLIFGTIAGWGVLKGIGLMDHLGNAIEGTNGARDVYRDAAQSVSESIKRAGNKVVGATLGAKEEIATWYEFNSVQITENGAPVDLVDSNFSILYNQVKSGNIVGLKTKDGKEITPEVKKKIIDKVNDLKKEGIEQFKNEKNFETEIKGKTMAEVIAMLADRKASSSTVPEKGAAAAAGGVAGAGVGAGASTPDVGKPAPAPTPAPTKEQIESEKEMLKERISLLKISLISLADKNNINNFDVNGLKASIIRKLDDFEGQITDKNLKESNINLNLFENILTNKISLLSNLTSRGLEYKSNYMGGLTSGNGNVDEITNYVKGVNLDNYSKKPYYGSWNINKFTSLLTNFDLKGSDLLESDFRVNVVFVKLEEKIKKLFNSTKDGKDIAKINLYKEYLYTDLRLQLHKIYKDSGVVIKKMTEEDIDKLDLKPFEEWKTEFSV